MMVLRQGRKSKMSQTAKMSTKFTRVARHFGLLVRGENCQHVLNRQALKSAGRRHEHPAR